MADEETLLGADQLPPEEQMVNADEALAEDITMALAEDDVTFKGRIVGTVMNKFDSCKRYRDGDESRWLQAYENYRGRYSKNVKFTEKEKSKVFVKATKTKVLAAYGQLIDVMFSNNKFPISVRPTPVPEGVEKFAHLNPMKDKMGDKMAPGPDIEGSMTMQSREQNPFDVGFEGDGVELPKGAKFADITKGLNKKLKDAELEAGPAPAGEPQVKPSHEAAKRMERLIHDEIAESNGATELRSAIFESCLLGTGIIKGPFNYNKTLHKWTTGEDGERTYSPEYVRVPKLEFCSIWNFYPDPNAQNMNECEWVIQRHKMSKSQLRGLKNRPFFDNVAINQALNKAPNYTREDFETALEAENHTSYPNESDRYEVLEYWGVMDREYLEESGIEIGDEYDDMAEVQVNVWVCGQELLRVVLNPFTPRRIPYLAFPYERNPYSFFGVGVAENMDDSQQIMNGHARMAIDNLALAGNLVFDIDEGAMVPGQSMEVFPGKIFKRQSGAPGQAVYGIKFPSTANENLQMFDKFRQIADETTGIPSYAHGQTGVMGTGRTAAGMSMLLGQASLNVKTVVKNIDDFLLKPLGEALFQWNMAFYEGELEIQGDLEVLAGGTASLMQNELMSQRITSFLQIVANPAIAPFVRIPALVKAFAESMDLDPDEFINDADQAKVYASIMGAAAEGMGQMGQQMPGGPPGAGPAGPMGQPGAVPPPAGPGDQQSPATPQMPDQIAQMVGMQNTGT